MSIEQDAAQSGPTEAQARFAAKMVNDPSYEDMLEHMRKVAYGLFEIAKPGDLNGLQEARLVLAAISTMDGTLRSWLPPEKE